MDKQAMRMSPTVAIMLTLGCGLATTSCTSGSDDFGDLDEQRSQELDSSSTQASNQSTTSGQIADSNNTLTPDLTAQEQAGKLSSTNELPKKEGFNSAETFIQRLPQPLPTGENVALHVKLPTPTDSKLAESLVRVVGDPDNPLVLVRSDIAKEAGEIPESPGPEFFTAFVTLTSKDVAAREQVEAAFASNEFAAEKESTVIQFAGRSPVAVTTGVNVSAEKVASGQLVALGPCPVRPTSQLARWNESLAINDIAITRDPQRTNDVCDPGPDNPDGVWTFKHLMQEMAAGSGVSTHDFIVDWLENWIDDQTINQDTLPARENMFDLVVKPWADASGVLAFQFTQPGADNDQLIFFDPVTFVPAQLDLNLAPFRLSAILNRIDLGGTETQTSGGYSGSTTTTVRTDPGELRFTFGVQNLDTCDTLRFSVIFEYGVPIRGCQGTRDWAFDWTRLNNPNFAPRFSGKWRDHLQSLTQQVVVAGAAPDKGNGSALNQLRTNENGLDFQWEFREFRFAEEILTNDPNTDTITPVNGLLRPTTVALTPDDTAFAATAAVGGPDPVLTDFVTNVVVPNSVLPAGGLPGPCFSSHGMTGLYSPSGHVAHSTGVAFPGGPTEPFRGGNSFTFQPTHWEADINPGADLQVCARHAFSFLTCNGCHFSETGNTFFDPNSDTAFFHIDVTTVPATFSNFMKGGPVPGGGGLGTSLWTVPDAQFGAGVAEWSFNDLHRRYEALYETACTQCATKVGVKPSVIDFIVEVAGRAPIDPPLPVVKAPGFETGAITDVGVAITILQGLKEFANPEVQQSVAADALVRPRTNFVH